MNSAIDLSDHNTDYFYSVYVRAADLKNRYFPWDNIRFPNIELAKKHAKEAELQSDQAWAGRFVIIKTRLYLAE